MEVTAAARSGMTEPEIALLVSRYLGGEGGYLHGFTYAELDDFYPHWCGLAIDAAAARERFGTNRKAFIGILREAAPADQGRIVAAVLKKFPVDQFPEDVRSAKAETRARLAAIADRLCAAPSVQLDALAVESEAVTRAIADAEALVQTRGPASSVDRVHTTLHGYLIAVARAYGLDPGKDPSTVELIKVLRQGVPALQDTGHRDQDIGVILRSVGAILGALDPIRNRASGAHPNDRTLDPVEALLVIDASRTVLNYLNRKLTSRVLA